MAFVDFVSCRRANDLTGNSLSEILITRPPDYVLARCLEKVPEFPISAGEASRYLLPLRRWRSSLTTTTPNVVSAAGEMSEQGY